MHKRIQANGAVNRVTQETIDHASTMRLEDIGQGEERNFQI